MSSIGHIENRSRPIKNTWPELDESVWHALTSLGSNWLGKWSFSEKGYSLIVSDGVDMWGEQRNASYIEDKAQEWAACLEAGVEELSKLVLSQLEERNSDLGLTLVPDDKKLEIQLTALLDQLPYNWIFYLSKLSHEIVEEHLTIPLATTLEYLSERIFRLEEELSKKTKQLQEILPPHQVSAKDRDTVFNICMETAVKNVLNKGIGNIASCQLTNSPKISRLIKKRKLELANQPEVTKTTTLPHNRPRPKCKKAMKGAISDDDLFVRQNSGEEESRRAQIQALTQAEITPTKKKKKLQI